jgi:hypothetical protein
MAEEKQDAQKTIVAFVVGLLIGGMLVWAFSGPADVKKDMDDKATTEESTEKTDEAKPDDQASEEAAPVTLKVGEGKVEIKDQEASSLISLEGAEYPVSEGWIGVRDYTDEKLGMILGVVRFSESQGLVPSNIILQRPTTAGKTYAVVIYTEDGDRDFNLAGDVQIDKIFSTFTAQ